jgi:hypothetical protein
MSSHGSVLDFSGLQQADEERPGDVEQVGRLL